MATHVVPDNGLVGFGSKSEVSLTGESQAVLGLPLSAGFRASLP